MKAQLVGCLTVLLVACGGGDGDGSGTVSPPPPPPPADPIVTITRAFANLTFTQPVAMLQAPGDSTRWFVVEQPGRVRVFNNSEGVTTASVFIDIQDRVDDGGEMGLLGMAFHPGFPTDRRIYLSYTNQSSGRVSRISEFTAAVDGSILDPNSEQIILTVDQPEANHNGGNIVFGPDDFLYIGFGDGGGSNDQHGTIGNAQTTTTLLGKMLRIDINGLTAGSPLRYRVPTDNPFFGFPLCGAGGVSLQRCPEIWAIGFRNPWRWSFDRQGGALWVADVGQSAMEEVDRVTRDGNYGWRCFEGTRNTGLACGPNPNPVAPIAEYGRTLGQSITGGYVYRGTAFPTLVGRYVFGDFVSGRIWNIPADTQPTLTMTGGFESGLGISSFAEANDGELYVLHYSAGEIYRIGT